MATPTSMEAVQDFLGQHRLALYGLSVQPQHFSHTVLAELRARDYDVVPVNPAHAGEVIDDLAVVGTLDGVQPAVDGAMVMTSASHSAAAVADALHSGVRRIWLYRATGDGAVSDEALALCTEARASVVPGECPLMFLRDAAWFHRLHGSWKRLTHTWPT